MLSRLLRLLHLISVRFFKIRVGIFGFPESLKPLEPFCLDPLEERLFVVSPHFDDETFGAFGVMKDFYDRNGQVSVICVHNTDDPEFNARYDEWVENVDSYCVDAVWCELSDLASVLDARLVESDRRAVVLMPSIFDYHEDHRAVSRESLRVLRLSRASGGVSAYFYCVYSAVALTHYFDITELATEKKSAIQKFEIEGRKKDWGHIILGQNAFLSKYGARGSRSSFFECFIKVAE